jgi:hypothetical protein
MKEIEIVRWVEKNEKGESIEGDLMGAIEWFVNNVDPKLMPRGIELARMVNRIGKAFDDAEKTKKLILEEGDYSFLKKLIERDIPANWGFASGAFEQVNNFLNLQ